MFIAKDMRVFHTAAILSNLAFIPCGTIEWLPPVLLLHRVLPSTERSSIYRDRHAPQITDDLTLRVPKFCAPACWVATIHSNRKSLYRPWASLPDPTTES